MKTDNDTLIDELLALTEKCTRAVAAFRTIPYNELNYKPDPETWSALECIEHLNRYGNFYLPELDKSIRSQSAVGNRPVYKSGLFGNYFARLMKVRDGKIVKMRTPADKNPAGSQLSVNVLDEFIRQQEEMRSLLERARNVSLVKARVPLTLTKYVRLRLGDTFRFLINHIERHVLQAERALAESKRSDVNAPASM